MSNHVPVTEPEIELAERLVMDQLVRAVTEATTLYDHKERTMATERVAHLSAALNALRHARGAVSQ